MTVAERSAVIQHGYRAGEIASLAMFLASALAADPETSQAALAVDGLNTLAASLSSDLLALGNGEP